MLLLNSLIALLLDILLSATEIKKYTNENKNALSCSTSQGIVPLKKN